MELQERNEIQFFGAYGRLESPTVFTDVFAGVPLDETKVQDTFAIYCAHAPRTSAEAMNQPGNLRESGHLEDPNPARNTRYLRAEYI